MLGKGPHWCLQDGAGGPYEESSGDEAAESNEMSGSKVFDVELGPGQEGGGRLEDKKKGKE